MLTLTRKPGQDIVLASPQGPITITVRAIRGKRVRLAVDAPAGTTIVRGELLARIRATEAQS